MAKFHGIIYRMTKPGLLMDDIDYIPLSGLSQAGYCLRRAALIMNESLWIESADTAKGRDEHNHVHNQHIEKRSGIITLYDYEVFSKELGLRGKCDCIEAIKDDNGCTIQASSSPVRLYPVEFKHGILRDEYEYNLQLCGQAMCLEEMYGTHIDEGAIFYTSSHRRQVVRLTSELRNTVLETIEALRHIRKEFIIPKAVESPKCKRCSLRDACAPDAPSSAAEYYKQLVIEATGEAKK